MADKNANNATPNTVAANNTNSSNTPAATSTAVEPEKARPRNENLETDHGSTVIDDNVCLLYTSDAADE